MDELRKKIKEALSVVDTMVEDCYKTALSSEFKNEDAIVRYNVDETTLRVLRIRLDINELKLLLNID